MYVFNKRKCVKPIEQLCPSFNLRGMQKGPHIKGMATSGNKKTCTTKADFKLMH